MTMRRLPTYGAGELPPKEKKLVPRMPAGKVAALVLLCISSLAGESQVFAFSSKNFPLAPPSCRHETSMAANYHYNPRQRRRQTRQRRGALSYPIGQSPLDQNNSWSEIVSPNPVQEIDTVDEITTTDKLALGGTVTLLAATLLSLLKVSAPGSWRYFLAGGICAAMSHAIPTPLDVVKDILKNEGMGALWAGLGPTAWGYLFEGSIKFGVYEALKPVIKNTMAGLASRTSLVFLNSQILAFILCGTASGLAASVMVCPMEALRIRMVADPGFSRGGMVAYGCKILKREGISGLAKGMNPMIMKQVPYTITKNVSFDLLTKFFYTMMRAQNMAITATTTFTVPFVSAAIASVLSCISSQPGDMVLSVINASEGGKKSREIFREIVKSDRGVGGLFVGFKTRMLHVGVIVTLQLLIYDYVKRLVGIAATGSL